VILVSKYPCKFSLYRYVAAEVCVRCLGAPPAAGGVMEFEVANGTDGGGDGKRDWKGMFGGLSSN
jgi:hypothetical protein